MPAHILFNFIRQSHQTGLGGGVSPLPITSRLKDRMWRGVPGGP